MRPVFDPIDPAFRARVTASFAEQGAMGTLGISFHDLGPGWVELAFSNTPAVGQQHGFVHAGVITTALDSACGYAALSLMPPDAEVLTVEFKVNLLRPAKAESFVAAGWVVKAGRTLTVCQGELMAADQVVAVMTATMMTMRG